MKKGDYFKQDYIEILTGQISLEEPSVFKTYFQLKALCFQNELKGNYLLYKHAEKRFNAEIIGYLIDEQYLFRVTIDGDDTICIPSITDNINDIIDYGSLQSIRGKLSIQKQKRKVLKEAGKITVDIDGTISELELLHLEEKNKSNTRCNTRSTIKNNNKTIENKNNKIEDLNNNTEDLNNNTEDLNNSIGHLNTSKEYLKTSIENREFIKDYYSKNRKK